LTGGKHRGTVHLPMSIESLDSAWFLQSPGSTYALAVTPEGYLQHWHWGARVAPEDLSALRPRLARPFDVSPVDGGEFDFSLNTLPSEFPFPGTGDFGAPAVEVEHADGTRVLRLRYRAHRILAGKPALPGLPAVYVENDSEAGTLEIDLIDELGALQVTLAWTVFSAHDVITRSARVTNLGGAPCRLLRVLSASVDFDDAARMSWLHLSGDWARERQVVRAGLRTGQQAVASARGASSHQHHPFFALLSPGADEDGGEVFGFSLVYSGNFHAGVELDTYAKARAQIGINPAGFGWRLEPGESFQTPEAVLVYSGNGLGEMSRTYHRLYRTRLCRGAWRDRERPVLINTWEVTYFDFDEPRLLELAGFARDAGVELFVLDDGWFRKKDDECSSLGDWTPSTKKLPRGLGALARTINDTGLAFGLWFEPEMVSGDSDLYRAHPDWCLHAGRRRRSLSRHQHVLDFSREEVRADIYNKIAAILRDAPVRYIKWDMNRHLSEVASAGLPPERQSETAHRHILGVYAFLEKLTREFPGLLIENCSGGGGRFDPGMCHYMPQTWTSDNSDAVSRLYIQHGTGMVYPLSTMGAHISAVPNHQVGRTTPLATRALVSMTGAFGLELDLAKLPPGELAEIKAVIARYKQWRPLLSSGDLYRLKSPFDGNAAAWMIVAPDKTEALVFHVRILAEPNGCLQRLRLKGLQGDAVYEDVESGKAYGGAALMAHGWLLADSHGWQQVASADYAARVWHLRRK
jgi:alpha-galactosidase